MKDKDKIESLLEAWRFIINDEKISWVVFEQGTCVIIKDNEEELDVVAKKLLKDWGPVVPGTSAGDFNVQNLEGYPGWVVECHHPDIVSYVSPEEIIEAFSKNYFGNHMAIGLFGRKKRDDDAKALKILHIEDNRNNPD